MKDTEQREMLLKHLIAEVRPAANKENIVYWNNYRITVLGDRLFRIERSARKIFRDAATQAVWFRDAVPQKYALSEKDGKLFLKTEKCELLLAKRRSDCRIDIGGGYIPISNRGNLKGTCRTLDGCNGNVLGYPVYGSEYAVGERIRLENGVCSKSGVAVYDDARSLTLAENGEICAERGDGSDEYVFAFGNDYRGAVKALYGICGSVPMLPRYALGNWWSRYHKYTQREYQRMIDRFEEHEVPLTVATLDVDWHYSNAEEIRKKFKISENGLDDEKFLGKPDRGNAQKLGWTGYTFNTALFPDYKKVLNGLNVIEGVNYDCSLPFTQNSYLIGVNRNLLEKLGWDLADLTPDFLWWDSFAESCRRAGFLPASADYVPQGALLFQEFQNLLLALQAYSVEKYKGEVPLFRTPEGRLLFLSERCGLLLALRKLAHCSESCGGASGQSGGQPLFPAVQGSKRREVYRLRSELSESLSAPRYPAG